MKILQNINSTELEANNARQTFWKKGNKYKKIISWVQDKVSFQGTSKDSTIFTSSEILRNKRANTIFQI